MSVYEVAAAAGIPRSLFSDIYSKSSSLIDLDVNLSSSESEETYSDSVEETSLSLSLSLPDSFDNLIIGPVSLSTAGMKEKSATRTQTQQQEHATFTMEKDIVRALLKNMVISDSFYAETKFKTDSSLSASELLGREVCELVLPLQRALEETRVSLDTAQKELSLALSAVSSQGEELQRYVCMCISFK